MFKKIFLLAALIFSTLIAQGCTFPQPFPLEDTQNILIAGFDVDGDEIVLTALVDSIVQSGEAGQEKIEHELYAATGKTVFEAKRNLHKFSEKRVAFYHTRYVLIGEQTARSGIDRVLHFFTEDDETNFLHTIAIIKDKTAKEYLEQEVAAEKKVPDILDSLFEETSNTGYSQKINLLDYAITRETSWNSLYIPTVLLSENPIRQINANSQNNDQNQSNQQPSMISSLEGIGVFDEDKLVGFLDANMARGMMFMINEMSSTAISVKDNKGENVALEVMQSKAEIKPCFKKPLSAVIEITIESNIDEYQEANDVLNETYMKNLEQQQSQFVRKETLQTLRFLQEKQTDVIGMGDAFYHSDPVKWEKIKDSWKSLFADLDIEVKVTSYIQCSYVMTNAVGD